MADVPEINRTNSALIRDTVSLLDPIAWSFYRDELLGKKPIVIRGKAASTKHLPNSESFENLICLNRVDLHSYLRFIRGGIENRPKLSKDKVGIRSLLKQKRQEGWTLILAHCELYASECDLICQSLSDSFNASVTSGIFSSGQNQQGRKFHIDFDEVFVLQLEGEKHWVVGEQVIDSPLQTFNSPEVKQDQPDATEVRLTPGDLLYVPGGLSHKAYTSQKDSLHVLFQVTPRRTIDWLVEKLTVLAAEHIELRKPVLKTLDLSSSEMFNLIALIQQAMHDGKSSIPKFESRLIQLKNSIALT